MKTDASEYLSLLQEIQNNNVSTFTIMPADEPRFTIDSNSRNITVPSEFSFLSVQNDHKAETIYFEIDRYFDDVDLSQHTCVIQFINKSGSTINEGTYPVTSMDIDSVDGKIVFGWEICNDATQLTGDITFSVRFYSIDDNGNFTYNFNTLTANSFILPSLNIIAGGEKITATELEVWTNKMNNLASSIEADIVTVEEKLTELENSIASIPEDYTALTEEVSQLSSDITELKSDLSKNLNYAENEEIIVEWYRKQTYFSTTDNMVYPDFVTDSTTRLLNVEATNTTDDLIVTNKTIKISVVNGFKYACALYKHGVSSETHLFLRNPNTEWTYYTEPTTWTADGDYNCLLIMLAKTDNTEVTLNDSNAITIEEVLGGTNNGVKERIEQLQKIFEPLTLPFANFAIDVPVYKENGRYRADFKPQDNFIKKTNGATVFISPNGSHDADGLTVLTPLKTIEECLTVENVETIIFLEGTYTSSTHFYVGSVVDKDINFIGLGEVIIDNVGDNAPITFTGNLYCENIHFMRGNNAVITQQTSDKKATFNKCVFSDSDSNNGLSAKGGITYVIECVAYGNAFDGFNYHANDTVINHAIEIDCVSYGNGTKRLAEDDGQSSNATTSHDGSYIVRVNGDYKCCHGGVVADKECYSANYGCKAGISTVTDDNYPDRKSNYWSSNAEMYLYDCVSYGSKYDTAIINGGSITSNVTYGSNYSN